MIEVEDSVLDIKVKKIAGVYKLLRDGVAVNTLKFKQFPIIKRFDSSTEIICKVLYPSTKTEPQVEWYVIFKNNELHKILASACPTEFVDLTIADKEFLAIHGMSQDKFRTWFWAHDWIVSGRKKLKQATL